MEVPVADPLRSGMQGNERAVAAASDGNDFLFIWSDDARYPESPKYYATRVTRDGAVLERVSISLPHAVEHFVWTGSCYFVVWTAGRTIQAMRLDRDGRAIPWPDGNTFRTLKRDALALCVANGKNVAIGYFENPDVSARRARALVVTADGETVADLVLVDDWRWFDIAWNGEHFAAAWIDGPGDDGSYSDPYSAHAIRFSGTGAALDPSPRLLLNATLHPQQLPKLTLESDGEGFLLLNPADGEMLARRVSGDLATTSIPHPLQGWYHGNPSELTPYWVGSHYIVLVDGVTRYRLDRDGKMLGVDTIKDVSSWSNAATTNGREIAVVWAGQAPGFGCADADIFATIVSASTLDREYQVLVSSGVRDQKRPFVATGGTNLLTVWMSGSTVYARRFLPNGLSLDASPLILAECKTLGGVWFNGTDYLVVLHRSGGFEITRVPREGPLRAHAGASVDGGLISIASDGPVTLMLWGMNGSHGIYVSMLGVDGSLLRTVKTALLDENCPQDIEKCPQGMTMSRGGGDFLVVWGVAGDVLYCNDPTNGGGPYGGYHPGECFRTNRIRGARISADLVQRDPVGFDIAAVSPFEYSPTVTWNGREWLVAWHSAGTPRSKGGSPMPDEIRGRLVMPDGTVDGNATGVRIAGDAKSPTVEWDGSRYLVSWEVYDQDRYDAPATSTRVAWFPQLGAPLTSRRDVFAGVPAFSVVATGPGTAVASYERTVYDHANHQSMQRVFLSVLESTATKRRSAR